MPTLLRSLLQNQLMVPAVEGTRNVVRAAKGAGGVRQVVVTSSISALVPSLGWPSGEVLDERCWTDIDYCEKNGVSLAYLPTPAAPSRGGSTAIPHRRRTPSSSGRTATDGRKQYSG